MYDNENKKIEIHFLFKINPLSQMYKNPVLSVNQNYNLSD